MHDVIDIPTDFARAYVFDMDGTIYLGESTYCRVLAA